MHPPTTRFGSGRLRPSATATAISRSAAPRCRTLLSLLLALLPVCAGALATGQSEAAAADAPLELAAVEVTPEAPEAASLCRLRVQLRNHSERWIHALAFDVLLDGEKLPVYERQVFMVAVPPGAGTGEEPFTLDLFNFWTSDSQRPPPADGKLDVEVRLREAQWLEISEERTEERGEQVVTEVWTPRGPVPGLPVSVLRTIGLGGD